MYLTVNGHILPATSNLLVRSSSRDTPMHIIHYKTGVIGIGELCPVTTMTFCVDIDVFEDPRHPLKPKIVEVVKTVYLHFDPVNLRSTMDIIDPWWRSPLLSAYQVDTGHPAALMITLNIKEGEQDDAYMSTHFVINLNTLRIHDKFTGEQHPVPLEILGVLEEIVQFMKQEVRARKEARDDMMEKEQLRAIQEEHERLRRVQVRKTHDPQDYMLTAVSIPLF